MLKNILITVFSCLHLVALGSGPRVPATMTFADIKLSITEGARRQIQADVDALHKNKTYFQRKVDKVNMYFPIIEEVFKKENLPDDFKYLTIQESALIADAVSSSNAVGFWQFKKESAQEVGLRVDHYIDERMHIVASTVAAARYLKKNNFFFDNWLYALLAYNTGPGGAENHLNKKYLGKKKMEINKHTHWYIKKYLAHKIAFENEIHQDYDPEIKLYQYHDGQGKTLKEIGRYFEIDPTMLASYNKWLKRGRIPSDKPYPVIIPVSQNDLIALRYFEKGNQQYVQNDRHPRHTISFQNNYKPISTFDFSQNKKYPEIHDTHSKRIKINGIPGFIASANERVQDVSVKYNLAKDKFLKYNDMTSSEEIIPGQVYYLKAKKTKAKTHYHVVTAGEDAWSISQKYGVKVKKLLAKNRMREEKELAPGMVVWLRFIRPANVPVEYKKSTVSHLIVKSIPNEIEYPNPEEKPYNPTEQKSNEVEKNDDIGVPADEEEIFEFEPITEKTEYVGENSYVDVEDEEKKAVPPKEEPQKTKEINNDLTQINHIVQSGETLFSISRKYGVSIGQIRQWNEIENLNDLKVGQNVLIKIDPNKVSAVQAGDSKKGYQTYQVKADDTLYSIARKNDISIKTLMELNHKDDFVIKTGEILKIRPLMP